MSFSCRHACTLLHTLAHSRTLLHTLAHSCALSRTLAHSRALSRTLAHSRALSRTLAHWLQSCKKAIRGSLAKMFLVPGQCNVRVCQLIQEQDLSLVEIKLIRGAVAYCPITSQYFTEGNKMTTTATKNILLIRSVVDES